jgi:hypothetical protein
MANGRCTALKRSPIAAVAIMLYFVGSAHAASSMICDGPLGPQMGRFEVNETLSKGVNIDANKLHGLSIMNTCFNPGYAYFGTSVSTQIDFAVLPGAVIRFDNETLKALGWWNYPVSYMGAGYDYFNSDPCVHNPTYLLGPDGVLSEAAC